MITLLELKLESSEMIITLNTMAADVMVSWVAKTSEAVVSSMKDQLVFVISEEGIQLHA